MIETFDLFLLFVGLLLTGVSGGVLMSTRFSDWMNNNLWQSKPEGNPESERRFNRYVRSIATLLIGVTFLIAFLASISS